MILLSWISRWALGECPSPSPGPSPSHSPCLSPSPGLSPSHSPGLSPSPNLKHTLIILSSFFLCRTYLEEELGKKNALRKVNLFCLSCPLHVGVKWACLCHVTPPPTQHRMELILFLCPHAWTEPAADSVLSVWSHYVVCATLAWGMSSISCLIQFWN